MLAGWEVSRSCGRGCASKVSAAQANGSDRGAMLHLVTIGPGLYQLNQRRSAGEMRAGVNKSSLLGECLAKGPHYFRSKN